MGVWTAMARGVEAFYSALLDGRTGVSEIVGMPIVRGKRLAAQIKDTPLEHPRRSTVFAREAAVQALAQARVDPRESRVDLFLATVCGDSLDLERVYRTFMSLDRPADDALRAAILAYPLHAVADQVARDLGLRGSRDVNTNACASGNIAIGRAMNAIRHGGTALALVCGTEQFRPLGYWGADRAGILGTALRPFHVRRDGTVLGDGAAALLLEEGTHAEARGAPVFAELKGYGLSCSDNPHEIIPPMEGNGVARCIAEALRDAGDGLDDVDYVNAHATGTLNIEIAECRGLRQAFGERARRIPVNATKSYSAHLSAASAVLEVIATVLAIERGFVHPNLGLDEPDQTLGVRLVGEQGLALRPRCAVSIAMGAGGANTAVVVRPPPAGARAGTRAAGAPADDSRAAGQLWFTGTGPVSVLGVGAEAFCDRILDGRQPPPPLESLCGVRHSGLVSLEALRAGLAHVERYEIYNRAAQLGLVAVVLAVREAGLDPALVASQRFGLIVGTSLGGTGTWTDLLCAAYESSPRHITPSISLPHGAHLCATLVARELGVRGPTVTLTSGTTAGPSGLAYAADLLRARELDAVAVCGVDILDRMLAQAYRLLGCAREHEPVGRRPRALLGEGAAAFVLERAESVVARGGRGLARLAAASEAFGLTPAGRYDAQALGDAMRAAQGASAGPAVVFSCAGGLASVARAEARALARLGAGQPGAVLVVRDLGRLLGATGAAGPMLSLAAAIGSLRGGVLPPGARRVGRYAGTLSDRPADARLLVPAVNPGGAAACVALRRPGPAGRPVERTPARLQPQRAAELR
jgi:3-oxoacyl-[acyl-carrier-protein] synthase II